MFRSRVITLSGKLYRIGEISTLILITGSDIFIIARGEDGWMLLKFFLCVFENRLLEKDAAT